MTNRRPNPIESFMLAIKDLEANQHNGVVPFTLARDVVISLSREMMDWSEEQIKEIRE